MFFCVVSLISSIVFFYRKYYMGVSFWEDISNNRFFYLLFLFVLSIFFLVFSISWVTVILGWDGLGLVSFLLVIYYNNSSSLDSGLITVFTNRIGDCLFIVRFIFIFHCGWFSFEYLTIVNVFIFFFVVVIGCVTKRAQIPFSSWLPAAMAAPTPVSSLVHSSTLVTAGVYLLIRFNYIFSYFRFLCVVSLFTMFLAGGCALFEKDFKKVVAISTLSQLGFIVFSVSMNYWMLGFFHIMFHAFFKSSLFLSTGSLMHYFLGNQDSRYYGSLTVSNFSKVFFICRSLRLMGFPFSLGFYSKDSIIGVLWLIDNSLLVVTFVLSCAFTVAYRIRLVSIAYSRFSNSPRRISFIEDLYFIFPVLFLYIFCVFSGNFFFNNFFPPMIFSFLESFLGVFVIIGGVLLFFVSVSNYVINFSYSKMFFLPFLRVFVSFGSIRSVFYKRENRWMEVIGGKGFLLVFNHTVDLLRRVFLIRFVYFILFIFLTVFLVS